MAVSTLKRRDIPSWEYVGDVYWWSNSWTCPADGFIEFSVDPSQANWRWFISDSKAPDTGWSHRMSGNSLNGSNLVVFAKEGAVFSTADMIALTAAHAYYYKFV